MKFKFVREVEGTVCAYGCEGIKTGGVIDLSGPMAEKAANNPDFQAVTAKKKTKKK